MNSLFMISTIIALIATFLSITLSILLSIKSNTTYDTQFKSEYLKSRKVDEKFLNKESAMMQELKNGGIKCNLLPNKAKTYDVGKWVSEMEDFMKKPIYQQLFTLEGLDIDAKY